jgi:protein-disulfide isomerase
MMPMIRTLTSAAAAALLMLAPPVAAEEFSAPQKSEIEHIVRDYLVSHPEVLQEAIAELEKRQAAADLEKTKAAVSSNAETLFNSSRQVVLGNPNGDVTMVEFFDYNCGYCKRAMADMLDLLKNDPKLKIILKEFPVLGPGSVEAAKVAAAVRMQDKTGKKYLDFHQKLLGGRGQADKTRALAVAKEVGFDMKRIETDMEGDEAKASLEESLKLGETLGLNGTPSYIVGTDVVVGAVGLEALRGKVATARCGKAVCS